MYSPKKQAILPKEPEEDKLNASAETGEENDPPPLAKCTKSPAHSFIAKSLNKFYTPKNYFEGSGHSLRSSDSTSNKPAKALTNSGFRRTDSSTLTSSSSSNSAYDNKFTEKKKSLHFSGTAHKLN